MSSIDSIVECMGRATFISYPIVMVHDPCVHEFLNRPPMTAWAGMRAKSFHHKTIVMTGRGGTDAGRLAQVPGVTLGPWNIM